MLEGCGGRGWPGVSENYTLSLSCAKCTELWIEEYIKINTTWRKEDERKSSNPTVSTIEQQV
jgi:hypothetical protein